MSEKLEGDFTIEAIITLPSSAKQTKDGWIEIPIERTSKHINVHTTEDINGEPYSVVMVYDENGLLLHKYMTHLSLVRG
jgi:hypothetical protein